MSYRLFPETPRVEFQNPLELRTITDSGESWKWAVQFQLPTHFNREVDSCFFQVNADISLHRTKGSGDLILAKCSLPYKTQRGRIVDGQGEWLPGLFASALNRFLNVISDRIKPSSLSSLVVAPDDYRIREITQETVKHYSSVFPLPE